mgnify:FL=1
MPVQLLGNASTSTISYFVQPISPEVILEGEVKFTVDDILAFIEPLDNAHYGYIENNDIKNVSMSEGDFRVTYAMMAEIDLQKFSFESLKVQYKDSMIHAEIYNHHTDSYEPLDSEKVELTDNIENYIDDERQIIFKVSRVGMDNGMPVELPTIELKGVVQK